MRILIDKGEGGNHITKMGWMNALMSVGHQVYYWDHDREPAFDVFTKVEPELFIGATYYMNRAIFKNIMSRPHLKVVMWASDWGNHAGKIDLEQFPILVAKQQEIDILAKLKEDTGKPDFIFAHYPARFMDQTHNFWKEKAKIDYTSLCNAWCPLSYGPDNAQVELESQISFIGGLWDYKRRTLFPYLFPLLYPVGKYKIKIYGYIHWGCPQYIGTLHREQERQVFASTKICPTISEPHSQMYGNDLIERPFKIMGNGQSLCVGDYVEGFRDFYKEDEFVMCKSPEEFEDKIAYFLKPQNIEERQELKLKGQKATIKKHSYYHRMSDLFLKLGLMEEAKKLMQGYRELLELRSQSYLLED